MALNGISIATEGYVCDGSPDPIAIGTHGYVCEAGVALKVRGGKGTPYWKRQRRYEPRNLFIHHAEAYFQNTLVIDGTAIVNFIPSKEANIINEWATPAVDSLFKELQTEITVQPIPDIPDIAIIPDIIIKPYVEINPEIEIVESTPTTFSHTAEVGGVTITGKAIEEYYDHLEYILVRDDDAILEDLLSISNSPIVSTTYDVGLKNRRQDDEDIMNILELL